MMRLVLICSTLILVIACMASAPYSASVGSNPPGIDKAANPEVKALIRKVWERIDTSPKTVYVQMKGTALGHEITAESWLGDGNIVAKSIVESTGVVTVIGDIDNTPFKSVNGKQVTMTLEEQVKQMALAHPHEMMRLLFENATRITGGHGHIMHEKTDGLALHGFPHGTVHIQFYEDGTLASMWGHRESGMIHATMFGDYKEFEGHKVPGRVAKWVIMLRPNGGWSAKDPGSHRLSLLTLVTAKVNEPIPPRIFTLSTWEPEKESKPGT